MLSIYGTGSRPAQNQLPALERAATARDSASAWALLVVYHGHSPTNDRTGYFFMDWAAMIGFRK